MMLLPLMQKHLKVVFKSFCLVGARQSVCDAQPHLESKWTEVAVNDVLCDHLKFG